MVKTLPANAGDIGDAGSIPGLGGPSGEGNSNPLQYSCLGNSMFRGSWRATVHGMAKSQTRLSTHALAEKDGGGWGHYQSWFIKRITREVCFWEAFWTGFAKDLGFAVRLGFKSLLPRL